jgi:acetyl esterase/lipase
MKRSNSKYAFFAVLFCLQAGLVTCQDQGGNESVRYLNPIFDNVDVQKDIVFKEVVNHKGEKENLALDVYTPVGDTEINRPAILWVHGGGFSYGNDKTQSYIVSMANRFAKRGYVGVSIDKEKIIVGGGSAGGMISVILCYKDGSEAEKWDKSGVIGLVNLWGSPDPAWRVSMVDKNDPPTVIVHGTEDPSVPYMNLQ